jgi:methionyl-tRNA formyltransferase
MDKKELRIIFMGTPDFAVKTLQQMTENNLQVVAVVTAPDKAAGRGRKIQSSPVKKYAVDQLIQVMQPQNLKDERFIEKLQSYKPDLFIVVAFRMLPEVVWTIPPLGCVNLHASVLPQYRGAAPINRAIINGEEETGVTTFFIEKHIDTGNIIFQEKEPIHYSDNAETLHDRLMEKGAKLIIKTIEAIASGEVKPIRQESLVEDKQELKPAPKIHKEDCKINWHQSIDQVYNFIRGLSPYPGAWTILVHDFTGKSMFLKTFQASIQREQHIYPIGEIIVENKQQLKIAVEGGYIKIHELQAEGKKRLPTKDFLLGFDILQYHIQLENI